jgi:putative transposase
MCSLFRNKYRIEPCRLKGHDYSKGGRYFVTICTDNKTKCFGHILNNQMVLSDSGQIAKKLWYELPEHFPFVSMDEFVVMPDHIHGIIIIDPQPKPQSQPQQQSQPQPQIPTTGFISSISPKHGSLASVIRSYKSAVSKYWHPTIRDFSWQSGYHDHLIRSGNELKRIRKYIIDNPINWRR